MYVCKGEGDQVLIGLEKLQQSGNHYFDDVVQLFENSYNNSENREIYILFLLLLLT